MQIEACVLNILNTHNFVDPKSEIQCYGSCLLVVVLLVVVRPLRYSVLFAARFTSGQVWYGIDEQIGLFPVPSFF